MNSEFYKKFENTFTEGGQLEFYSKVESMKKDLEGISNPETKAHIEKNISNMIISYENMKKYYFECVEYEKKIKEHKKFQREIGQKIFNQKIKFIQKAGYMFKDNSDEEFGLSNN